MEDRKKEVEEYLQKKKQCEKLIDSIKIILSLLGIIVCIITGILVFIYRLRNPHLTETELLIYSISKYWWADLWFIVGYFYLHNN